MSRGPAYPLLIKQCLLHVRAQAGSNEIVYRAEKRFSYPEWMERVWKLGSALGRRGVGPGDVVAVMEWDTHRYLECFFAVPMLGAVLQTVNIRTSVEQIRYALDHAGAQFILCNAEFAGLLRSILARLPKIREVFLLADDAQVPDGVNWSGGYESILAEGDSDHVFPDFDEETIATTFYTSGTTGAPKGVAYSHRQIVLHTLAELAMVALGDSYGRFGRDSVYMPITPMFHGHAWGLPYVATMAGCKQVYPGRYTPEGLIKLYVTEKVTYSHCVPTLLQLMLTDPSGRNVDFSGWQVLVGGAAVTGALVELARSRGVTIVTGYGMSETGPMLTMTRVKPDSFEAANETAETTLRVKVGMPIPLVDLRIVDEEMRDIPVDGTSVGEIVARAPWLTREYRHDPEATRELWRGGYLHTQDIGQLDRNGYLRIVDRLKDMIKSGGEWVSSLALEDIISRHGAVLEVAVIGVPHPQWTERPVALVVLREGQTATCAEILAHVEKLVTDGQISRYWMPDSVLFVASLDRTSVGKIDKKVLRARHQHERQ